MTERRPRLLGGTVPGDVRAVALLLPGGFLRSRLRPFRIADLGLTPPRHALQRHASDGLATPLLRYRYAGWNGAAADTEVDTRWALDQLAADQPGAPIVLVGNSLGGRAAIAAADHPAVCGVVGLAPWLPAEQSAAPLSGRPVLIVHGSADRSDAPASWSREFAERARDAGVSVARFEVPGAGHLLLRRQRDWSELIAAFTLAVAGLSSMPAVLVRAAAMDADLAAELPERTHWAPVD